MGTATTGTVCPCACESHVRAANPGDPFFDYFLSNYLSTFHQTIDEGSGTWDQHERFLQTHRCVFIPCSRVWQVLNSASCLECACANCQCTLGELGDIAWQPFLKPVCSYFWIIFGFSVFLERNKTVQGARAEVFLNGFKAVSRVIPTMFFVFFFLLTTPRWLHSELKYSCQVSAQHNSCPESHFEVCYSLRLIPKVQRLSKEFRILPGGNQTSKRHILASRHRSLSLDLA